MTSFEIYVIAPDGNLYMQVVSDSGSHFFPIRGVRYFAETITFLGVMKK